jgi:PrgI family protein
MQFQVPQFIETEDKVVGPLSLRQFMYIGAAGLGSAILYFTVTSWLWLLLTIVLLGAAIGIAFIKIGGRPLGNVLLSGLGFYWRPQTYIWKSEESPGMTRQMASQQEEGGFSLENIITGVALHKRWENLQTGQKGPENKSVENKMNTRYQIFQRASGARTAARRVDYR